MHQMHLQLLFSPFVTVVVGSLVEVRIFYMDGKRQSIKLAFGNFYSVFLSSFFV